MKNEKMVILTLLKEEKITSNEAVSLLKALDCTDNAGQSDSLNKAIEGILDEFDKKIGAISQELSGQMEKVSQKLQGMLSSDSSKMDTNIQTSGKSLEDSVSKIVSSLSQNTDDIASQLSQGTFEVNKTIGHDKESGVDILNKSIKDIQKSFGSISIDNSPLTSTLSDVISTLNSIGREPETWDSYFKKEVCDASSMDLQFQGLEGNVYMAGYDGCEIEVKVYCKSSEKNLNDIVSVIDSPHTYGIEVNEQSNTSIALSIRVPRSKYQSIRLTTCNAKIRVSDILCKTLICATCSGKIYLSGISCDIIEGSTSGGKIELADIKSESLLVNTSDSPIIIYNIDCRTCDANTSRGKILLELPDTLTERSEIRLSTDNAGIDIELPPSDGIPLCIDIASLNGRISMDIPGITYTIDERNKPGGSRVAGETSNFKTAANSISITASTTNATVTLK